MVGVEEGRDAVTYGMDYAGLFRSLPTAYLVLTPDLVIVDANDAYLQLTGRSRDKIVGLPVFEVFPPPPDALDEDGRNPVRISFEQARDTGQVAPMPLQKYDITGEDGVLTERFWSLVSAPVLAPDGTTRLVLQRVEDVTDYVQDRDGQRAEQERGQDWQRRVEAVETDLFARVQELRAAVEARDVASQRLAGLAEVVLQLANAENLRDLVDIVTGAGLTALGTDGGAIGVRDRDRDVLHLTLTNSLGADAQQEYAEIALTSPLPAAVVVRTGEAVVLPTLAAGLAHSAEMAGVYDSTGKHAWVALPMRSAGRLLGSLLMSWSEEREFPPDELELLEVFAAQCAQALDRLQIREIERRAATVSRRLSEALQLSLLTAPPEPEGLQIAVRYLPAVKEARIGGDWYDAFLTPDGGTTLVVGDVTGHDRDAAATMGQLRNVLRGIAQAIGKPPAVVLSTLDQAMQALQVDSLASAVLCQVLPESDGAAGGKRAVRWSNAGHPPPVLVGPDGTAELLTREPDLLLGLQLGTERQDYELLLPPDSTVVLYSDGLVERRGEPIDVGLERLRQVAERLHACTADALCDALLDELAGDREDDVALLVVRICP